MGEGVAMGAWLREMSRRLRSGGYESPRRDLMTLLAHYYEMPLDELRLRLPKLSIEPRDQARLERRVEALEQGKPLPYVTGVAPFYGELYEVTEDVLIPRPDTEILLESFDSWLDTELAAGRELHGLRFLDVGTGSGIIVIAAALAVRARGLRDWRFTATDLSPEALRVARRNAQRLAPESDIHFERADLWPEAPQSFDVIFSNPPYINEEDYARLDPGVRDYEPSMALLGGVDGLDFYRRILSEGKAKLSPRGLMAVEIGYDQGEAVRSMMAREGFRDVRLKEDYGGRDRVVLGHL